VQGTGRGDDQFVVAGVQRDQEAVQAFARTGQAQAGLRVASAFGQAAQCETGQSRVVQHLPVGGQVVMAEPALADGHRVEVVSYADEFEEGPSL
jgi:hypothetical protein